ncbi:MAG: GNAT family N-acetyltransferase [Caldilineaceae bacterium]|nr:GNAT family N-acetyltransferase [Caldilineaceae bacterium]
MNRRPYQSRTDVALLQTFNAHAIAETAGCGYLQPGDIPHHIFSGNKYYDPAEVLTIWEDESGVAGWALADPSHGGFDAQVRPDLRGGDFDRELLTFVEAHTVELMQRHGIDRDQLIVEGDRCDTARVALLKELGWHLLDEPPWVVNRAPLVDLPAPVLPAGFTIRAATGVEEAAALVAVHVGAFGSTWTPDLYRKVMESPGYAAEREFVVVAPDGAFAAFTVTWHDEVNRTGLFEPVGTHRDYQRRGLGKALLLTVMHKMAAAGLEHAIVVNEGTNEASRNLYRSCGFQPWHLVDDYAKAVSQ